MGRKHSDRESAVSMADMLANDVAAPTPFIVDALFLTPSGKRVRFNPACDPYVHARAVGKGTDNFCYEWDELRALYRQDPECLTPESLPMIYVGTGVRGLFHFMDLAVVQEYLDAEPFATQKLPGKVGFMHDYDSPPEYVEVLSVGSAMAQFRRKTGEIDSASLNAFAILSADQVAKVQKDRKNAYYKWSLWWDNHAPSLAEEVGRIGGPWNLGDRRELALVGEGTASLAELLACQESPTTALLAGTPAYTPEGEEGVIRRLTYFEYNEWQERQRLEVKDWAEARRLTGEGTGLMVQIAVGSSPARSLAPELVRIPLSAFVAPKGATQIPALTVKKDYDPEARRTSVRIEEGGSERSYSFTDLEVEQLEERLADIERARARLEKWLGHKGEATALSPAAKGALTALLHS